MTDILYRLRHAAADKRKDVWGLYREAADEIERLRSPEMARALEECVHLMHADTPSDGWKDAIDAARAALSKHRDHNG